MQNTVQFFFNDIAALSSNGGLVNTSAAIEVINDAVIVPSIEAFNFTSTSLDSNKTLGSLGIYPTLATDFINITADEEISSIRIFSLEGKVVYNGTFTEKVDVSALKSGFYIIEAITISNNLLRKTFLKK